MNKERLFRRIRSLLCVASKDSGATEAEQATARRLANKLMTNNGWKEKDIPERQQNTRKPIQAPAAWPGVRIIVSGSGGLNVHFDFSDMTSSNQWTAAW